MQEQRTVAGRWGCWGARGAADSCRAGKFSCVRNQSADRDRRLLQPLFTGSGQRQGLNAQMSGQILDVQGFLLAGT